MGLSLYNQICMAVVPMDCGGSVSKVTVIAYKSFGLKLEPIFK